jgi:hypothetical protein
MEIDLLAPCLFAGSLRIDDRMGGPAMLHVHGVNPRCGLRPHALHQRRIGDRPRLRLGELLENVSYTLRVSHVDMLAAAAWEEVTE